MEFLTGLWDYAVPFLLILTLLVFVHELGHYWVARRNGVRIETFSIGFGPELLGWTDKAGTRWKISAVPLGGYVKMFGDSGAASTPDGGALREMTPEERAQSFHFKRLPQRAAIVAAGPIANFLFAIVVYALLFMTAGQPFTPAEVGSVVPDSAAAAAGLKPGDRIVRLDGQSIERFEDIQRIIQINPDATLPMAVVRDGASLDLTIKPQRVEIKDRFGHSHPMGQIGIARSNSEVVRLDPATAVWSAMKYTAAMTGTIVDVVGQMIAGTRSSSELGGVLRIAQFSGEVANAGLVAAVNFIAMLSINLGLVNLVPVPMLDGGHLAFYALEGLRGRPLGERAQEYGFRIGFVLVLALMLFATWNDLVHFRVVEFVRQIIS